MNNTETNRIETTKVIIGRESKDEMVIKEIGEGMVRGFFGVNALEDREEKWIEGEAEKFKALGYEEGDIKAEIKTTIKFVDCWGEVRIKSIIKTSAGEKEDNEYYSSKNYLSTERTKEENDNGLIIKKVLENTMIKTKGIKKEIKELPQKEKLCGTIEYQEKRIDELKKLGLSKQIERAERAVSKAKKRIELIDEGYDVSEDTAHQWEDDEDWRFDLLEEYTFEIPLSTLEIIKKFKEKHNDAVLKIASKREDGDPILYAIVDNTVIVVLDKWD